MEPKLKLPGHPDGVFGGEKPSALINAPQPRVLLTEEVAALAASFNINVTPQGNSPYEPDAFIAAIRRTHDTLLDVKVKLTEQNTRQGIKEAELKAREEAVAFRERRVQAMETMAKPNKWWRL